MTIVSNSIIDISCENKQFRCKIKNCMTGLYLRSTISETDQVNSDIYRVSDEYHWEFTEYPNNQFIIMSLKNNYGNNFIDYIHDNIVSTTNGVNETNQWFIEKNINNKYIDCNEPNAYFIVNSHSSNLIINGSVRDSDHGVHVLNYKSPSSNNIHKFCQFIFERIV